MPCEPGFAIARRWEGYRPVWPTPSLLLGSTDTRDSPWDRHGSRSKASFLTPMETSHLSYVTAPFFFYSRFTACARVRFGTFSSTTSIGTRTGLVWCDPRAGNERCCPWSHTQGTQLLVTCAREGRSVEPGPNGRGTGVRRRDGQSRTGRSHGS